MSHYFYHPISIFYVLPTISVYFVVSLATSSEKGCKLEAYVDSLNLPLIQNKNGTIYPNYSSIDDKWILQFEYEELFSVVCPNGNHLQNMEESHLDLQCLHGPFLMSKYGIGSLEDFQCAKESREVVTKNGTCYNGYTNVHIEFPTESISYTLVTVCHNEEIDETIFSRHELHGAHLDFSEPIGNRPNFKEGVFYAKINAAHCYKEEQQIATIAELVGSLQLAEYYVQGSKGLFLARGHLTPSGDPIYKFEKRATYYYINVTPQWQTINGGNFLKLEVATRTLAKELNATFTIWTGSYGIMKLKDINDNFVEIWLGKDYRENKRLPVAQLTWKVIHNQKHNSAIAVIYINNPWLIEVSTEDIICQDVCDSITWINWNTKNIIKGYTYCCDVASFKQAVPYAPDLGNLPLLDYTTQTIKW